MEFVHKDSRFTVLIEGQEAGYLEYERKDNLLHLVSTVVDPKYRGQGLAAQLVDEVAKYAREHNIKTIPVCSYIVSKYDAGGYEDVDAR